MNSYFLISLFVLAALLFYPVSKLIWVLSVGRLQKKSISELSRVELEYQLKRARVISFPVVLVFSFLFNISIGVRP